MKTVYLLFFLNFLLLSCLDNKEETPLYKKLQKPPITKKVDSTVIKKEIKWQQLLSIAPKKEIQNKPCLSLIKFAKNLQKQDLIADPTRLQQVKIYSELKKENIQYFKNFPFYKINFSATAIASSYNPRFYTKKNKPDSLEYDFLKKSVQNIWGYFYRDKNATDWISDGVIEQWEFKSPELARTVMLTIKESNTSPFFNTNPFYYQYENKLFIFHTRAMAFSYDQKILFENFVDSISN